MISIVTTGFMVHHSWLLSTGTTTNESFKWADLKEALDANEVVVLDSTDPFMYIPLHLLNSGSIGLRGLYRWIHLLKTRKQRRLPRKPVEWVSREIFPVEHGHGKI
jgi:hypothetical protein